jgi:5-methylcytosine-specific restriction endonuclease McrA
MKQKIVRYCKTCGGAYFGHKSKLYCSEACRKANPAPRWNKGLKGLPARRPRNGVEKICEVCGKAFYVPASETHIKHCSQKCYFADRWGNSHKEIRTCVICNNPFEVFASDKQVTCSKNCSNEYKSRNSQGEKSVFWRGGKMAPYIEEWQTQRRAARERDGHKCVLCGSTDRIQVHHIIPFRYSQSHELDNLVTLCRSCHSKEELKVNKEMSGGLLQRWKKHLA